MDELEWNKIFAAVLVAGIVAMLSGFISKKIIHPDVPEKAVIDIDTSALETASSDAPAKPQVAELIDALLASANIEKGEKLSRACAACHTFNKGGPNRVGPNLWNIVNRIQGVNDTYAYSDIFNERKAEGRTWTYESLNQYLWKPKVYAPGTKMNYIGLRKTQDRADMIKWLRSLSDNPAPLPRGQ